MAVIPMLSTLAYLAGLLATLLVGIVIGVWFTRLTEPMRFAELLRVEDALRESAGAVIRQERQRLQLADAWQADQAHWEQAAEFFDTPVHEYREDTR